MIKIILLLILGYILLTILKGFFAVKRAVDTVKNGGPVPGPGPGTGSGSQGGRSKGAEDMVKDEVCGKFFMPSDGVTLSHKGQTHHFCSDKCKDDFLKSNS